MRAQRSKPAESQQPRCRVLPGLLSVERQRHRGLCPCEGAFGQQLRDLLHRGHGDQPTTQAVGDRAATAGSSSAESCSATTLQPVRSAIRFGQTGSQPKRGPIERAAPLTRSLRPRPTTSIVVAALRTDDTFTRWWIPRRDNDVHRRQRPVAPTDLVRPSRRTATGPRTRAGQPARERGEIRGSRENSAVGTVVEVGQQGRARSYLDFNNKALAEFVVPGRHAASRAASSLALTASISASAPRPTTTPPSCCCGKTGPCQ